MARINQNHGRLKVKGSLLSAGVLATQVTTENLQKCHDQSQSLLFSIPPEIRNTIFQFATSWYDDPEHQYTPTDYYYRPGHHAKQIVNLSLLRTCRRIWLEANAWHIVQAPTPTFWFGGDERRPVWTHHQRVRRRRTRNVSEEQRMIRFFSKLTETDITNLKTFRVFAQMTWLESNLCNRDTFSGLYTISSPPILVVTIRHTDWWWWESEQDLRLESEWLERFLSASNTDHPLVPRTEFRLELETLDYKSPQLLAIIQRIQRSWANRENALWELQSNSGKQTLAWSGPTNIYEQTYPQYAHLNALEYRVFTLVWRRRSADLDGRMDGLTEG